MTSVAKQAETFMQKRDGLRTELSPQGLRDPDGRLGVFVICSDTFGTARASTSDHTRRDWVLLAVFATVQARAYAPLEVDYIALTDANSVSRTIGYYGVDFRIARMVFRQFTGREVTPEGAYALLLASWRRVTP